MNLRDRPQCESTGTENAKEADAILALREGAKAKGVPITAKVGKIKFEVAAAAVETDYELEKHKSLSTFKIRVVHLRAFLGGRKMVDIGPAEITAYKVHRQGQGAENATINRELTALKRMFNLAREHGHLLHEHVPTISLLKEKAPRNGFFERHEFEAVLSHLPERLRNIAVFGYNTGWRLGEVINLEWRHIDRRVGEVRLDAGTTKNGDGRVLCYSQNPAM